MSDDSGLRGAVRFAARSGYDYASCGESNEQVF
jgi:hypothetical protein